MEEARPVPVRAPGIATITCRHGRSAEVLVRLRDGEPVLEHLPICLACGPVRCCRSRSGRRLLLFLGEDAAGGARRKGRQAPPRGGRQ